jgi:hypothetical protein
MATGIRSLPLERKVVRKFSTIPFPPWSGLRIAFITRLASSRLG